MIRLAGILLLLGSFAWADVPSIFAKDNLVAWCVVPFDAKKRGPEERAAMLERIGITKLAYDYRAEHIPTFDAEMEALKRHGIELTAWWFPTTLNDEAKLILSVLERHRLRTQLWVTGGGEPTKSPGEQAQRVAQEAERIRPIAEAAAKIGCQVALYNHGGWFGEPENQLAVIEKLGLPNVGIVYNQHHGHEHLDRFAELLGRMKPRLLALNLNGMTKDGDKQGKKIMPLGQGDLDYVLLKAIRDSGWRGPVGLLNHTDEDAEARLLDNLDGLHWLGKEVAQLASGGQKPTPRSWIDPSPKPVSFPWDRAPLRPEIWPHRTHPVNRDRLYDFYAKQARHFLTQNPRPDFVQEFPGIDGGGNFGHWGNQKEETWVDGRWSKTDLRPVIAGVFQGAGLTIPKAVCVSLGEQGELSACFDPERLSFRAVWREGFVRPTPARHGLIDGLRMEGTLVEKPTDRASGVYRGYHRHGRRVIFAYQVGGVDMLDSAWAENGQFIRHRAPAAEHPLRGLTQGGPARWPQVLETAVVMGEGKPFALDTLTLPYENPWGALFFVGGHDFFANGDAALCSMTGDVWRVSGVTGSRLRWKRMASGLHQPLGLVIVDDVAHVLGRDQITRLHDRNGDGEADHYECLTNAYATSAGGHDYICGLERDREGHFVSAAGNLGVFRVKPGQAAEVLAAGFRNPNGVSVGPDGSITTSAQEGDWTPASMIYQIRTGGFYGYPGTKKDKPVEPPLVYLPRGIDNCSGGQCWVESDRWGIARGQLIHFAYGSGTHLLVLRENVGGLWQGAAIPLDGDFLAGPHRGRFSPHDGQLYVSGMTGWGTYTPADGCFQRVRYTGGSMHLPDSFQARDNGVLLHFTEPLAKELAGQANRHFAQCWNYRHSQAYGSPEFSLKHPGAPGHDVLEITSAHVLGDGRSLFLEMPQIQPANQIHLHVQVTPEIARDVFLTAHRLGSPFTDFPGYRAIAKTQLPQAPTNVLAAAPNPFAKGEPGRALRVEAGNGLAYATTKLEAKAGERLSLTFVNPDVLPHNWALLQPGSVDKVGDLANKLIADPNGAARSYVPEVKEVLAYTDIVAPNESATIHFTAPSEPGKYPYLCTFPGHWMLMRGTLVVKP